MAKVSPIAWTLVAVILILGGGLLFGVGLTLDRATVAVGGLGVMAAGALVGVTAAVKE